MFDRAGQASASARVGVLRSAGDALVVTDPAERRCDALPFPGCTRQQPPEPHPTAASPQATQPVPFPPPSPTTSPNIVDQSAAPTAQCQARADTGVSSTPGTRHLRDNLRDVPSGPLGCRIRLLSIKTALRAGRSACPRFAAGRVASIGSVPARSLLSEQGCERPGRDTVNPDVTLARRADGSSRHRRGDGQDKG